MKILLVEDDPNKRRRVTDFLQDTWPSAELHSAISVKSALSKLVGSKFSVVVLDMTLPMFDSDEADPSGSRAEHFGGKHLLKEMELRDIACPTVVLTQFDVLGPPNARITLEQLDSELRESFGEFYIGCIYYAASEQRWRNQLIDLIHNFPGLK